MHHGGHGGNGEGRQTASGRNVEAHKIIDDLIAASKRRCDGVREQLPEGHTKIDAYVS